MRAALLLLLVACAHARPRPWASERSSVERFFGAPFPRPFAFVVYPSRAALVAKHPDMTECWMVGHGTAGEMALLDPAAWRRDACEHDPADRVAISRLVAHELVHVYHSQLNDFLEQDSDELDAMGWFVEGLAVFASGQLDDGHLAVPPPDFVPASLATTFDGKFRYFASGALVRFIDGRLGRRALLGLARARSNAEILHALGMSEPELLAHWKDSGR